MEDLISRPLDNPKLVRHFLQQALQYTYDVKSKVESQISKGETGISNFRHFKEYNTYEFDAYRVSDYSSDESRWELRKQIVEELTQEKRLANDDQIKLTHGGACPLGEILSNREAFIITGLPASGKSGIANSIADEKGALIIDSDYAKRKLPEYDQYEYGATLLHKESSRIVSGFTDKPKRFDGIISVSEFAITRGYNVVLPKIGHTLKDLLKLAESYRKLNYKVHLTLVNLDRRKATIRAIERYLDTDRYVPLGLIFDGYGNDPILNYYQLKSHFKDFFESFGMISTNVNKGEKPKCIECFDNNPAALYEKAEFYKIGLS